MAETLYQSMLDAQWEMPALQRDKLNPHFKSKYLSLEKLLENVLPVLNKHGLVWTTLPSVDDTGTATLKYSLIHAKSGRAISGEMGLVMDKSTAQGQGSAITYAKRYSLCAVLSISADEDDDGNATSGSRPKARPPAKSKTPKPGTPGRASSQEIASVRKVVKEHGDTPDVRLAFTSAGVDVPGRIGDTIAGLTSEQANKITTALQAH